MNTSKTPLADAAINSYRQAIYLTQDSFLKSNLASHFLTQEADLVQV